MRMPRLRRTRAFLAPVGRVLRRVPHPPLHSRRGLFVLFMLITGFGVVGVSAP